MRPPVEDPAAIEVDDLVGERDRRPAVGHHDDRRRPLRSAKTCQDRRLDAGVDGRRGVVEDEQPRPAHQRARQGQALPLSAGERGAALADVGVETVRQRRDEAVGLGEAQRRPDRLVVEVGAERHVAAHRVVEEEGVLGHQGSGGRHSPAA